ncbi:MAG TPA: hypothetical protein VFQ65_05510 [Kofleriaceae bacterium]|nr:hypothetical protein [Kofleriaceae bacterium]
MKALLVLPFLVVAALVPAVAHADQCELVSDQVATRALDVLAAHPNVIAYCEPCGDRAPGEPHRVDHLAKQRDTDGYYSVTLDKREIDLAYTYVQTAPSSYENVAALAGCPTSGVSPSLAVADASDHGVLITASPVPHVAAPPPPAPTTTITYVVSENRLNWLAVLAACAVSTGLWALTTILLLRRRRTLAMRPRAIDMVDRS